MTRPHLRLISALCLLLPRVVQAQAAAENPPEAATDAPPREAAGLPADGQPQPQPLPLELTPFGDFGYHFSRPHADDFQIGVVELDVTLQLVDYVTVATALAYSGEDDAFGLGSFVIDCGLAGEGDGFVIQSRAIQKSGVAFGKFDVPFGIAYLEYASVSNRLGSTPAAVLATHQAWSDLGMQAYAVGSYWTALAYLVNGQELSDPEAARPTSAGGGRLSVRLDDWLELGGSFAAHVHGRDVPLLFGGGDASFKLGRLDLRGEYVLRKEQGAANLHGAYERAVLDLHPAYLVGRFDAVFNGNQLQERDFTAGAAFEVFPNGEIRALYEQSLDQERREVVLQLVGGTTFQPTGLRR